MDQENKFGEYWKKFLEYWNAFLTQCGVYWAKAKRYGKKGAQYAALYLLKFRDALVKLWEILCMKAGAVVVKMEAWLKIGREKAQPMLDKAGAWWGTVTERFPALKFERPEALPAPEAAEESAETALQTVEAEDPVVEAAPEEIPEEEVPVQKELPAWMNEPWAVKTLAVLGVVGTGIKLAVKWIWKLRTVIMAVPVVWAAVKFAMQNAERLPEQVGLDIQSTGEFATMISRQEAVWWPLGITGFCLLLMFCSKKPLLPWVISIFTLVLPWLIWVLNYYA